VNNHYFFFVKWLYVFETIISPSSGATFNILYSAVGTFMPVRLAAVWMPQPDELYSLLNVAPEDGLMIVRNT
jgi:hypothetical protein